MAGENESEWAPKTRDDWKGLFSDAFETAQANLVSKREEAEAKAAAEAASQQEDKTGGKGGDSDGGTKRKSFGERLLGL
jgi:hypothetical protein